MHQETGLEHNVGRDCGTREEKVFNLRISTRINRSYKLSAVLVGLIVSYYLTEMVIEVPVCEYIVDFSSNTGDKMTTNTLAKASSPTLCFHLVFVKQRGCTVNIQEFSFKLLNISMRMKQRNYCCNVLMLDKARNDYHLRKINTSYNELG